MLGVVALPLIISIGPPLPRIRDARFVLHAHPFPPSLLLRFHSPILHRLRRALPKRASLLLPKASVGRVDYVAEPATNVNFPKEMNVLGCSAPLVLLGTGMVDQSNVAIEPFGCNLRVMVGFGSPKATEKKSLPLLVSRSMLLHFMWDLLLQKAYIPGMENQQLIF